MKKFLTLILFVFFISLTQNSIAQTPKPTETPQIEEDSDVVVITTNLVQMDVVVTDKKGNQVTDLKPEDFDLFVNGKKQDISNFSYIFVSNKKPKESANKKKDKKKEKYSVPPPPSKLKLEKIRRTYAIVVDDLGLSFSSVPAVRQDVRKFINEEMQEGDLVAIVRTGSGIGALQSFTTDKRQLLAAINKIRWNPQSRGGINYYEPIQKNLKESLESVGKGSSREEPASTLNNEAEINDSENQFQEQIKEFRNENFSVGTLGGLNYVIRGMRNLPGRKAVMFFSEGFSLVNNNQSTQVFSLLKRLADIASRSSVVIYTFDPRGLVSPLSVGADEDVTDIFNGPSVGKRQSRVEKFRDSLQSLRFLAAETGGRAFVNRNNLTKGLKEAVDDQSGYYLLAYQPDDDAFDPSKSKFNKISIKVKRSGLKVRYRKGFFGIPDSKLVVRENKTAGQQIYGALTSPFGASGISLSLNTLFAEDSEGGKFIRSLVSIDAKDLKFNKQDDGTYKANFDILAMTFGDNGTPIDETSKNYTIRVGEKPYQKIINKGFVYNLLVPIKKPGAYQFRVALRDSVTTKVGSASQFIEVPNLKKKRLTLSSIVLDNYTAESLKNPKKETATKYEYNTALRQFKRGTILRYDYLIYNAKTNPVDLEINARLFHNGKIFMEGKPSLFDTNGQVDLKRMKATGVITLGKNLIPGDYVLQIVVIDKNAKKKKYKKASNWINFEIIE